MLELEYQRSNRPWVIGFSGGKDSSAVLKLVYRVLQRVGDASKPVRVVYCDTGVDIPVIASYVRSTLASLGAESAATGVPMEVIVAMPRLEDRYFVKVIGRGYPTPTNKFRWCTDVLRIDPVQHVLQTSGLGEAIIILGTRSGESRERDKAIARHALDEPHYYRQAGSRGSTILAPIDDFDVTDVWATLFELPDPLSLDVRSLARLYRDAGNECPTVRDQHGAPCGASRFGCWTCTVVRKDRSMTSMVSEGHIELAPLLGFRNWLMKIRDDPMSRCQRRRNGGRGPGPFTLSARKLMLRRLRAVQGQVPWQLISDEECVEIKRLWRADRESSAYARIEAS